MKPRWDSPPVSGARDGEKVGSWGQRSAFCALSDPVILGGPGLPQSWASRALSVEGPVRASKPAWGAMWQGIAHVSGGTPSCFCRELRVTLALRRLAALRTWGKVLVGTLAWPQPAPPGSELPQGAPAEGTQELVLCAGWASVEDSQIYSWWGQWVLGQSEQAETTTGK